MGAKGRACVAIDLWERGRVVWRGHGPEGGASRRRRASGRYLGTTDERAPWKGGGRLLYEIRGGVM